MKLVKILCSIMIIAAAAFMPLAFTSGAANAEEGNASAETDMENLKFKDGKFKIMIFSDTHNTDKPIKDTITLMSSALDKYNPDLLVFLGDNTGGWWRGVTEEKTRKAVDELLKPVAAKGTPFAFVFGNHAEDGDVMKDKIFDFYKAYPNCLAVKNTLGDRVGNYNLTIKSSDGEKDAFNLWFIDSGSEADEGGYAYVTDAQKAWYEQKSDELKAANGGEVLKSLLFQHIAVPEVYDLFDVVEKGTKGAFRGHGSHKDNYYIASDKVVFGEAREGPCPPDVNNGQFASWKSRGDVVGAFFGHDHINNYSGLQDGVRLTSCISTGFYSYGNLHGVTLVELDERDLSTFGLETKFYEEIVGEKPSNALIARWGYIDFNRKILPAIIVCPIAAAGVALAAVLIVKRKKRKKNKKAENND